MGLTPLSPAHASACVGPRSSQSCGGTTISEFARHRFTAQPLGQSLRNPATAQGGEAEQPCAEMEAFSPPTARLIDRPVHRP